MQKKMAGSFLIFLLKNVSFGFVVIYLLLVV